MFVSLIAIRGRKVWLVDCRMNLKQYTLYLKLNEENLPPHCYVITSDARQCTFEPWQEVLLVILKNMHVDVKNGKKLKQNTAPYNISYLQHAPPTSKSVFISSFYNTIIVESIKRRR